MGMEKIAWGLHMEGFLLSKVWEIGMTKGIMAHLPEKPVGFYYSMLP